MSVSRRGFLQSISAALLSPALPTLTPAAASPTLAASKMNYIWAHYFVQAQGKCSTESLANALNVSHREAASLISQLQHSGVVDAFGRCTLPGTAQQLLGHVKPQAIQRFLADRTLMMDHLRQLADSYFSKKADWRPRQDSNLQPAP